MPRNSPLIPRTRACVVCNASLPVRVRPAKGQSSIISITPILYRLGKGKRQLKNACSVRACEPCLLKALTEGQLRWSIKGNLVWDAIREAILDRLRYMIHDDETENPQ